MSKKSLPMLFIASAISAAIGCSTAKVSVMPGENGINRVVVRDIERDDAEEEAVSAANKFCEKHKQSAFFVSNKTTYTGSMDEGTRNTVRKASTAAMILGGTGVGASADTRTGGAVLGSAGTVGHTMTSDRDYQTEIVFKCK